MKLDGLFGVLFSVSALSFIAGSAYIVDCRFAGGDITQCWLTGLPLMGLGGAGVGGLKSGFNVGYNTYNPALRKEDQT